MSLTKCLFLNFQTADMIALDSDKALVRTVKLSEQINYFAETANANFIALLHLQNAASCRDPQPLALS